MPSPRIAQGPVVLVNAGDQFIDTCRIAAIVWEGPTTSGDTVALRHLQTNQLIWSGRTNMTQTYLGVSGIGESCPYGFYLSQISSGRLLVYLASAI